MPSALGLVYKYARFIENNNFEVKRAHFYNILQILCQITCLFEIYICISPCCITSNTMNLHGWTCYIYFQLFQWNFQIFSWYDLIFSCPPRDRKRTNRYPWGTRGGEYPLSGKLPLSSFWQPSLAKTVVDHILAGFGLRVTQLCRSEGARWILFL